MSNARVIHTHFIIELKVRGWEYHLTMSQDLKSLYDVDVLEIGKGEQHYETELIEIVQDLFFQNKLNLDE